MKRFYVDLLGFAVEWEPDPDNVYLSSGIDNSRCTVAADAATATRRRRAASRAGALDHLGLIVRHADDVDRWAAFLESRGVTLDAKPQHPPRRRALAATSSDPDGNSVQIIHHPPISESLEFRIEDSDLTDPR